ETGAVVPPFHLTTSVAQAALGRHKGYEYSRTKNPTRSALETCMAELEGGVRGFAFASGMSAITTTFLLLKRGDHVVCEENVYGGTYRVLTKVLEEFGLAATFVDASRPKEVEAALTDATKMVYLESPTNPNLKLVDLSAVSKLAHDHGAVSVVDNTFLSPYYQNPLALGADIVLHSATKYLGGHSDVLGGVAVVKDAATADRMGFLQNAVGAVLSPFDSFLVLRGVKTLHVRMDRHTATAQRIAEALARERKVKRVNYPGLATHPQAALAKRQSRGQGGMLSFELADLAAARRFCEGLRLCHLAESLGAVETIVTHPASMTHASIPKSDRERMGLTDGLVRISVGLEDADDLVEDVFGALKGA
ncbi:MAG: trans-sulfuration enzyme family protein, partial [Methanobacteriota archaeon]